MHARLLNQPVEPEAAAATRRDEAVDHRQRAFFLARQHAVVGPALRRRRQPLQPLLQALVGEPVGHRRVGVVAADDGPGDDDEDQEGEKHQRTSVTPSNMSPGRWMPDCFSFSQHFGRMPVARKRPITLPSPVIPIFSKTKISCMVMMSPSMPVISETLVTLREPSLSRVCCTTS